MSGVIALRMSDRIGDGRIFGYLTLEDVSQLTAFSALEDAHSCLGTTQGEEYLLSETLEQATRAVSSAKRGGRPVVSVVALLPGA